jgi:predicted transcriptional regulator
VIYASSPVRRVLGEFSIDSVLEHEPDELWFLTAQGAGVDREFFDDYFRGRAVGFAVKVGKPRRYARPRRLLEHYGIARPPQSFCYLTAH